MQERRSAPRVEFNTSIQITVDGRHLEAGVSNLSQDGALIIVEGKNAQIISDEDVGRQVELIIGEDETVPCMYAAKIVRLWHDEGCCYWAVRFTNWVNLLSTLQ